MSVEQTILQETSALDSALSKLKAARKYRRDKRTYGAERVEHYVSDVEGDWLENWSVPDEYPQGKSPVSGSSS
ncbi:MAG: hypothetical protein GVY04_19170 [Cyanobacteria bacterium]|jgi:hypothetical protein|nr:hypothetical protein [Cyanobacteria bacterium GSL.Bin1]